jgi:hypothetical protein
MVENLPRMSVARRMLRVSDHNCSGFTDHVPMET